MIITVTAPKKGLGQSVTAINLAAKISRMFQKKALIIDLNRYATDVEAYLCRTPKTKGLDEFINRKENNLLQASNSFLKCVQTIYPNLDMMSANQCFPMGIKDYEALIQQANQHYELVIVDTIAGNQEITSLFSDFADKILVVLNQESKNFQIIHHYGLYQTHKEKIWFVVNRWQNQINGKRVSYDLKAMKSQLNLLGFDGKRLHILPMEAELLNACNQQTLIHYCFSDNSLAQGYHVQLERLVNEMYPACIHLDNMDQIEKQNKLKALLMNLLYG